MSCVKITKFKLMKKRSLYLLIVLLVCISSNPIFAQNINQPVTGNTKKQMKRLDKLEKKKKKEHEKAEKELLKEHVKSQDKGTRKMMRRSKKKSSRSKKGKHVEPFWKKWFRKK